MSEIYKKLMNIQQTLKAQKSQRNSFGNYTYRSCEDIVEAVKPLLKDNNCVLLMSDEVVNVGIKNYVKASAALQDADGVAVITVTGYAREAEAKKGMDDSQITGSTSSYARKYALNGLFAIDDTKDNDTNERHIEEEYKAKQATKEEAKPITKEHITELTKLAEETETVIEAMCKYFKVKTIPEMNEGIYKLALKMLSTKHKKNAEG